MDSRQWREALRVDLRRQNLPPAYIERLIEELTDHSIDLQTENPSMDAHNALHCLGDTQQLAIAASHEFRSRTFAGRHPWLTFVVAPFAFVPVVFAALVIGAIGLIYALSTVFDWIMGDSLPTLTKATEATIEAWCVWGFESYVRFVPFVVAAWLFCRWGQRNNMRHWALAACSIVALFAGILVTSSTLSSGDQTRGTWVIGFALHPNLRQFFQLAVPLVVAAWLLLRLPKIAPQSSTASDASAV